MLELIKIISNISFLPRSIKLAGYGTLADAFNLDPQDSEHASYANGVLKRGTDLVLATLLLLLFAPLMVLVAIAVSLSSRGPVLYTQKRLSQGGKVFTMCKFRTMRVEAEASTGAVMATKSDPRITVVGRFLRRTRLDELPQLLNVLVGDMSMIGPRPERPEIAAELVRDFPYMSRRLDVKAGITGLAQVENGYAACTASYREKLRWDLHYIREQSLSLDLYIAWKTVWVVLSGFGAR